MNYTLMHNDYKVMNIITDNNGTIKRVRKVFSVERVPLSVEREKETINVDSLNRWFEKRTNQLLIENGIIDKEDVFKSKSLSLTDHYWVADTRVPWREVSLHVNDFDYECGNLLFMDKKEHVKEQSNLYTADIALNGKCKKSWRIRKENGARVLIKMGNPPLFEEAINEVFGYKVAQRLGIPTAKYKMILIHGCLCAKTKCFTSDELEFISANEIIRSQNKKQDLTKPVFEQLIEIGKGYGLDIEEFLEKMIMLDCIIGNTDRNLGNFGFLRKVSDLEIVSIAPLFDYGNCEGVKHISIGKTNEKLYYIENIDLSIPNLDEIYALYEQILEEAIANGVIKENRKEELLAVFKENAKILEQDVETVRKRNRRNRRQKNREKEEIDRT